MCGANTVLQPKEMSLHAFRCLPQGATQGIETGKVISILAIKGSYFLLGFDYNLERLKGLCGELNYKTFRERNPCKIFLEKLRGSFPKEHFPKNFNNIHSIHQHTLG